MMTPKSTEAQPLPEAPIVPDGFTQADTDVDNYPVWNFDTGDLAGVVVKVKTVELVRRGEAADVRMAVVDDAGGLRCILWESANLGNFFDAIGAGTEIHVVRTGMQQLSGGRSMTLYNAFYK